jgi:bifunctional UDP-N-acetylglucosamine pyrophosphorylase/glucosamine-1-phosphate N-acetyltransferase
MSGRRALPGVRILDPARIWIEPEVEVGAESVLYPDVALLGQTVVGRDCTLHQGAWLRDTRLGDGVVVEPYSVLDGAVVGDGCRVGPFARLRPGAVLERNVRVGNFVEVKQSRLGEGAKANHLAYLGDAQVGAGANIGAGVVTCNYDGIDKHPTTIGRDAFVGSDTMLVAPVRVGDEATTAAGSVITQDVEDGALAVGRSKQRNIPGWAARRAKARKKKKES